MKKHIIRSSPFFKLMGENIAYMGGPGKGQHTKMSNQILIAGTMIGVVESLLDAYKGGMKLDEVIEVIGQGAASSWSINKLGPRIAENDFDPGFFHKRFCKKYAHRSGVKHAGWTFLYPAWP